MTPSRDGGESRVTERWGFYEFFCGDGMARAGLGEVWPCLSANDIDAKKARSYAANWGDEALRIADIHKLAAKVLRGRADLAWASFPCQDLSLAGAGLAGAGSGAFWGFHALMKALGEEGRAPRLIALENVVGALTSNRGADFIGICRALRRLGYVFGALTIDAAHFLPQSRRRGRQDALAVDLGARSRSADGPCRRLPASPAQQRRLSSCRRWRRRAGGAFSQRNPVDAFAGGAGLRLARRRAIGQFAK
jgi:DNA (cytosine-5)-methyltransferase 1